MRHARLQLSRLERTAWIAALAGAALCVIGAVVNRNRLAASYLANTFFFNGLSLGSLALIMVHGVTGGQWGRLIRRGAEAAARVLPVMAILFVPLLVDLGDLYPWIGNDVAAAGKSWYLNRSFFVVRAVVYFVVWIWLAMRLSRRPPEGSSGDRRVSAGGLLLYALTTTFAAVDWLMSLEPRWFSSVFGLTVSISHTLAAMAFLAVIATLRDRAAGTPTESLRHDSDALDRMSRKDLGNLLLTLLLLWSYLFYMEYLTIWTGNLPPEISWYVPRLQTSWRWLTLFVVVVNFVVPFLLLLLREVKCSRPGLMAVGAIVLVAHWGYGLWLVVPSLRRQGLALAWEDFAVLLFMGGLWLVAWIRQWRAGGTSVDGAYGRRHAAFDHA